MAAHVALFNTSTDFRLKHFPLLDGVEGKDRHYLNVFSSQTFQGAHDWENFPLIDPQTNQEVDIEKLRQHSNNADYPNHRHLWKIPSEIYLHSVCLVAEEIGMNRVWGHQCIWGYSGAINTPYGSVDIKSPPCRQVMGEGMVPVGSWSKRVEEWEESRPWKIADAMGRLVYEAWQQKRIASYGISSMIATLESHSGRKVQVCLWRETEESITQVIKAMEC